MIKFKHSEKAVKIWKNIIPTLFCYSMSNKMKRIDRKKNAVFQKVQKIWKFIQTFYNPLYWVTWAMCNICQWEKLIVPLALPVLEEVVAAVNGELLNSWDISSYFWSLLRIYNKTLSWTHFGTVQSCFRLMPARSYNNSKKIWIRTKKQHFTTGFCFLVHNGLVQPKGQ